MLLCQPDVLAGGLAGCSSSLKADEGEDNNSNTCYFDYSGHNADYNADYSDLSLLQLGCLASSVHWEASQLCKPGPLDSTPWRGWKHLSTSPRAPTVQEALQTWTPGLYPMASPNQDPQLQDSQSQPWP